ncbi:hypothetical protein D9M70_487620 [compost metagenome]
MPGGDRLQLFDPLPSCIEVIAQQQDPALLGQAMDRRAVQAEATEQLFLVVEEIQGNGGRLLQQVEPGTADRGADHGRRDGGLEHRRAIGQGLARLVDPIQLVAGLRHQCGGQGGAP